MNEVVPAAIVMPFPEPWGKANGNHLARYCRR